jgi:hypothetical protein
MASEADTTPSDEGADETKRKFREALERKKAAAGGGAAHTDGGVRKPRAHGPVENRREFRRKSG